MDRLSQGLLLVRPGSIPLYQRLILDGLVKLHKAGKVYFFGDHAELADKTIFDAFLNPLRKIEWVVYAKEPFAGPKAVLAYLSRHTHRIAISNTRPIRFDAHRVTFKVKNYRLTGEGRNTTMTLGTSKFIRRILIHVLPKGQHRIRHYGFFGKGKRAANIERIRERLGAKTPNKEHGKDDTLNDPEQPLRVLGLPCTCCGGQLIIVDTIAPAQHPRASPEKAKAAARFSGWTSQITLPLVSDISCEPFVMPCSSDQSGKSAECQ